MTANSRVVGRDAARGCCAVAALGPAETPRGRSILGFDGVDSAVVEQMLAAGRLPHLAALKQRGGYSPLTPTVPAQTPVSWATFTTGLDPGGHEIFDFLKRNPADRVPTFAVAEETTAPILFGKSNPVVLGLAAGLVFWIARALLFLWRRTSSGFLVLDTLGVLAFLGVFFALRAWLPDDAPGGQEQPTRRDVLERRRARVPRP